MRGMMIDQQTLMRTLKVMWPDVMIIILEQHITYKLAMHAQLN